MSLLDEMYVIESIEKVHSVSDDWLSEHLKGVPDTLESMISEKRLLQASILLVKSLKMINKGELMEIGGLADLRSYLTGQETVCCLRWRMVPVVLTALRFRFSR